MNHQSKGEKIKWIEVYKKCGCSTEAGRKKDLLGYCEKHGTDRREVYKLGFSGSVNPILII